MPAERVVDHQAHWYPTTYLESILDRDEHPSARKKDDGSFIYIDALGQENVCPPSFHSLDRHLADMDENGIAVSVISPNLLGEVSRLGVPSAVETLEFLNAETGRAQQEHPDRIVGLAMLPMQDPDAAVEVLDRAVHEHDLVGVCLLSNIAGRPIVGSDTIGVYRRIEELGLPMFLHPSHSSVVDPIGYGPTIEIGLGWMFETAAAALSLIYGGVLDACPDLVVVHPHFGGALPSVVDRVVECEIGATPRYDLRSYLTRNFYVDSVQKTPGAATLAIDTYGLEKVVYATDFPWVDRKGSRDAAERVMSSEQLRQVFLNAVPRLRLPQVGD
jgi:aminocarboxymuconate-semialdehyde decarboxylase